MDFSRIPARSSATRAASQGRPDAVDDHTAAGSVRSPGTPLAPEVRRRLEARLGEDLGGVRVHRGPEAARAARDLGAIAYTSGEAIVLGDKAAADDEHLLAHEAAHVVQQRHASRLVPGVSARTDSAEQAADAVAAGASRAATGSGGAVAAILRQADGTREKAGATHAEAEAALTDYLQRVQREQGGQALRNTEQVKSAVSQLFVGDAMRMASIQAWLSGAVPGTPAAFAHEVAGKLPGVIPAERLDKLRAPLVKADADKRPKTAEEAAGALIVDSTVTPIVRGLKLSPDVQKKIVDGAKSALTTGVIKLVDTVLDQLRVAGADKASIHGLVEALIKQQAGKSMDRKQDGAGSPYAPVVPSSAAPKAPSAPGETIVQTPAVSFDFSPVKPPPKPGAASPTPSQIVSSVAAQLGSLSLTPAGFQTGGYDLVSDFAAKVEAGLNLAQKKHEATLYLELSGDYTQAKDKATIIEAAMAIVFAVRDALPHHASSVTQIYLRADKKIVRGFRLHPGT
jgi:hypothetical protein